MFHKSRAGETEPVLGDGGPDSGDHPTARADYTGLTPADAEQHAMARLQAAVKARAVHTAHAEAWEETTRRNHFGQSIKAAMELGRGRGDGDTNGG